MDKINNKTTVIRTERGLSLAGTRITLCQIKDYIRDGWTSELIRKWLDLTEKQIADAMEYISQNQDEVEAEYQSVLQESEEIRKYWEECNREKFAHISALPPKPGREIVRAKILAKKDELGI